jgi:hypothetical protein
LGVGLGDDPPDHSTISPTRRLIALETHRAVFTWVLQCLGAAGLVKGKTIGIDATTREANAALRSIVRRGNHGPTNTPNATPCMRIAVASEALAENASFDDAVNRSNAPAPISMKPVGCGVLMCAATRTC